MRYLGVIVLILGALFLIAQGVVATLLTNTNLIIGLVVVILGYVLHIFLDKKAHHKRIGE